MIFVNLLTGVVGFETFFACHTMLTIVIIDDEISITRRNSRHTHGGEHLIDMGYDLFVCIFFLSSLWDAGKLLNLRKENSMEYFDEQVNYISFMASCKEWMSLLKI
jgi:hypothetical protein